jgi:hypothetical protein
MNLHNVKKCIVHANCPDGLLSALLLHDELPSASIEFVQYGSPAFRNLKPEPGMLFADFSPPVRTVKSGEGYEGLSLHEHEGHPRRRLRGSCALERRRRSHRHGRRPRRRVRVRRGERRQARRPLTALHERHADPRLSTRSHTTFDCAAFAKAHGGGGHTRAAGFALDVYAGDRNPYAYVRELVEVWERLSR